MKEKAKANKNLENITSLDGVIVYPQEYFWDKWLFRCSMRYSTIILYPTLRYLVKFYESQN
jgi:hypothetical protein